MSSEIARTITDESIGFCLERVGKRKPGWSTLVVSGSALADVSPDRLWAVLADLERWSEWSPLHRAAAWTDGNALTLGSRFEQQLDLGFPLGRTTEEVTLAFAEPERRAGWAGDTNGVKSCHLWRFARAAGASTEVSNVEVFSGTPVGLIKPLVARRWRHAFQAAVDGLVATAEGPS